ncbi:putative amp deaminase [Phaeomoniella chlamydospora]|uniref:AMP deaminase n=1 Tax=Phaeomoniella chlamydospora TaxID=158046 RepID=A0A0G2DVK6_PHACM|nr:putative amp deaminase [Phaeomoniella chlamydospora]
MSHLDEMEDGATHEEQDLGGERSDNPEAQGVLSRKNPFYDYAAEKSDSQADAKLIFQRHRLESSASAASSPKLLSKSATLPPTFDGTDMNLSRTTSRTSNVNRGPNPASSITPQSRINRHSREPSAQPTKLDTPIMADQYARSHAHHPGLPHEYKDSLLASQGVHGAGAGVGIGSGYGGYASNESSIVTEVEAICKKIKTLLDIRHRFLKISLQCPGDNPKDDPSWEIYPPPPEPVWTEGKERPGDGDVAGSSQSDNTQDRTPTTPSKKKRKAGEAIGEDFDISECKIPGPSADIEFELDQGSVFQIYHKSTTPVGHETEPVVQIPTLREYYMDLDIIQDIASDGPAKSFAYRRLQYLEGRYNLYTLLNEYQEVSDTKKVPHRDFYNVRKVDTHVHHSACMNQKHLLRFIKSKMKKNPDEIVLFRDGMELTLKRVFESINLTAYDLSIDTLDMHAHTDSFHRFDKFNLKYNPIGQSRLREIFLKTDNYIKGRYLAEITREVIADLESSKYQMVEWRISIYGRSMDEWSKLAAWVVDNKLFSNNARWLIQVPRLYDMYKANKMMENFESVIKNVFQPLFEVTKDPARDPKLHIFLQRVIGFDSVDDESKVERRLFRKYPSPKEWNTKQNPPYSYWIYYLFSNMASLNHFRKMRGFNTFLLRPHCGEAGDTDHLAAAILGCHSISHGITLRKVPILQYIFYLDQIGIAMSPLSNNALFLTYDRNPFVNYFRKGLNVSLSTDDPLQFAFTKEPLIEEYSVAAQIYKFSSIDMCELAKHSVDQSGFELQLKQRWLGRLCHLPGVLGNDVAKCNVPDIREAFRHETLVAEHAFIAKYTNDLSHLARLNPIFADGSNAEVSNDKRLASSKAYYASLPDTADPPSFRAASALDLGPPGLVHRERGDSRASMMEFSPTQDTLLPVQGGEPRMFPGLLHRRQSLKLNASASDSGMDSSMILPSMERLAVDAGSNEEAVET